MYLEDMQRVMKKKSIARLWSPGVALLTGQKSLLGPTLLSDKCIWKEFWGSAVEHWGHVSTAD